MKRALAALLQDQTSAVQCWRVMIWGRAFAEFGSRALLGSLHKQESDLHAEHPRAAAVS